jgi:cytoskeleton protein RodZ
MVNVNQKSASNRGDKGEEKRGRTPAPSSTVGSLLRERREAMGASLAEVESATKIRQKYLSALEADEWQLLPGEVVGRGFLRNYATYLGVEPTEMIERRRAIADPNLATVLADTSAGTPLPPMREVDYRPKAVDLRDEPEGIEERQPLRLGPILAVVGVILIGLLLWWSASRFGNQIVDGVAAASSAAATRVALAFIEPTATPTTEAPPTATPAAPTPPLAPSQPGQTVPSDAAATPTESSILLLPTATPKPVEPTLPAEPTPTPVPPTPTPAPQPATVSTLANLRSGPGTEFELVGGVQPGEQINIVGRTEDGLWFLLDSGAWIFAQLIENSPGNVPVAGTTPGATPLSEEPTPTLTPTEIPTEAPQAIVAPAICADPRAQISSPGQGQVVSGVTTVTGTAVHEAFSSYKIEAAPAGAGFVFLVSGGAPVEGGVLGAFDSSSVPNGQYTLRLTVVDQTGNFPPPCDVTVTVQN